MNNCFNIKEKDCVYEMDIYASYLNQNHDMKPHAYQALFEQMAERHLTDYNCNVNVTMEHGLAWALVSMTLEVINPIRDCIRLSGHTWYSKHQGPYFRRELIFQNEDGLVMFKGSTFSVLLDIEKRTVCRKKELPFEIHQPTEEFLVEASPNFKTNADFKTVQERHVLRSHIDCLGHVNNCRYGEYSYDAFSDEEMERLQQLKRLEIYFNSELRDGDTFAIEKAAQGEKLIFRGFNNTKEDVSFNMTLEFASDH